MSFDPYETSVEDGNKAECYEFSGTGLLVQQTSASEEVDLGSGEVYEPAAIDRSGAEATSDHNANSRLEVYVPRDHPVAVLYRTLVPATAVSLRIIAVHVDDPALQTDGVWLGTVRACTVDGDKATLTCEPIPGGFAREGLRMAYERRCGYQLFQSGDPGCNVVAATYTVAGVVSAVSGNTITATAFSAKANGWFTLGKALVGGDIRLITAHSGSVLTLLLPFSDTNVGDVIQATAGCDRLRGTCNTKFGNLANYPGCDWIPTKNPFQVGLDG